MKLMKILILLFLFTFLLVVYLKNFLNTFISISLKDSAYIKSANSSKPLYSRIHTFGFYPINDKGIYSFMNVCIEYSTLPINRSVNHLGVNFYFQEKRKIHIYNSFVKEGEQTLTVATSCNSAPPWNSWDIDFHHSGIPKNKIFLPDTAFFFSQTCPANLHHFWTDEFIPLFSMIRKSNRLLPNSTNYLLYRRPVNIPNDNAMNECFDANRYQDLLSTLYISSNNHFPYFMGNADVCYSSGVFGHTPIEFYYPRQAIDHILKFFFKNKRKSKKSIVVFLQRSFRRIINLNELMTVAGNLGENCQVHNFNNIPVKKQIKIMSQAKILVGVQGAGLQWAVFMPENSTLIEIAWPHKHWGFYYEQYMQPYKIKYRQLVASNVKVNWTSYENKVKGGVHVDLDERMRLMEEPPKTGSLDNVWKWADAFINANHFKDILNAALY